MKNTIPVWKDGKVIGNVTSIAWKQASKLLGSSAVFAKRECGWCWTAK